MKIENIDFEKLAKNILLFLTIVGFIFSIDFVIKNIDLPGSINVVLIIPFVIFLMPYLILSLYEVKKIEMKMQIMPRFLRDIVDNVESGIDLISAIKATSVNDYSVLNEDIRKIINQLSWGINFEKALILLAKNVGSNSLKRDFLLVIEARKVGGHVEKILRELSKKISNENLRTKERRSNLASNTFTGYISFLIFISIIIIVYNNLFVGIAENMNNQNHLNDIEQQNHEDAKMNIFLTLFILLSYELAILSGFLFGLMQEGNILAGAPHVVLLTIMTFIGFFFFI